MLPDRSVLIGQKLVENAKIEKLKCDSFGDFQTLCVMSKFWKPQKSLILQHCELKILISYCIACKSPKMSQFSRQNNPNETFFSNFLTLLFWAQI